MLMLTVSPLTPVPEMTGSVVVVSVLPLAGLEIVGAAGAATATLTVSRGCRGRAARRRLRD
jgi:hypothetical protein